MFGHSGGGRAGIFRPRANYRGYHQRLAVNNFQVRGARSGAGNAPLRARREERAVERAVERAGGRRFPHSRFPVIRSQSFGNSPHDGFAVETSVFDEDLLVAAAGDNGTGQIDA